MLVIVPIRDRIKLLPYFLHYYTKIGATQFACGLFNGKDNPLYSSILAFKSKYPLEIHAVLHPNEETFNAKEEALWLNQIRENMATTHEWYCIADLDEFHYLAGKTLPVLAKQAAQGKYEAVEGMFVDRIAANGCFPKIHGSLDRRFPLGCNLTQVAGLCCRKIILAQSQIKISPGHHDADARVWENVIEVHHFKWHRGVYERALVTHNRYARQNIRWARRDLPKLLKLIEHGINIYDDNLLLQKAKKIGV